MVDRFPWRLIHGENATVNIVCLPVEKAVHRAWLRKPVAREAFDLFREGLKRLFDRIDQGESEEPLKRIVADFLNSSLMRLALINICDPVQGGFYA